MSSKPPPGNDSPPPQGASLGRNTFAVGTKIGEFEILGLLGEGGFGIVYLAHDQSLDRKVALKEYLPAQLAHRAPDGKTVVVRSERHTETFAAGLRSFINESRLLARFDHHSLVKVYRFWEENDTAYMVMPFYEGVTLTKALKDLGGPPDEAWLKALLANLLDALEVMHDRQCFHRDVAPDNILMQPDGTPLLLDFGAARRVIGERTQPLTAILKPGYAPIEQYAEDPNMRQGPWTDLYALASVMYFAITSRAPVASIARAVSDSLTPLSEAAAGRYSEQFLQVLDSALTFRPEQRPQSVAEVRLALGLGDEPESTVAYAPRVESRVEASAAPPKKKIFVLVGAAVAGLAIAGVAAYLYFAGPSQEPIEQAAVGTPPAAGAAPDSAAKIKSTLASFECARLESTLDGGAAAVRGHVTSDDDLARLRRDLAAVESVKSVRTDAVQVVPPSYCGALLAVTPYLGSLSAPPLIALKNGRSAAFEGDKLITEVTAGSFDGFVYADLYDIEGNVVHLLPNPGDKKNEIKAKQRISIGEDALFGNQWSVVPPFGKHLLVVIVAKRKLLDSDRPEAEPAFKYLTPLQEALKRQQPQGVAANYTFIDFSPKR